MSSPDLPLLARRLYDALLLLYPAPFRRLYARDMREAFAALHARTAEEGAASLVRLWIRTAADAAVSGLRERLSRRGYRVGLSSTLRFPRIGAAAVVADALGDLRYALRTLGRAPAYTAMAVLTLALGIGANSAVFSVLHGVLIAPLPFPAGDEVVHVRQSVRDGGAEREVPFSVAEIHDVRERVEGLAAVAEYHRMSFTLVGAGEPDRVQVGVVSHDFFDLLGVRPALGREFVPAEDRAGADPVLVLGHAYWQLKFRGDPEVVGRVVRMNGREHRIVGVLPDYPQFPQENDVYMPVSVCPQRSSPEFIANRAHGRMMDVFARLAPGASLEEAGDEVRATLSAAGRRHADLYGERSERGGAVRPLKDEIVDAARAPVFLLMAAAAFTLLIACANAANLALARANRRIRETSIRAALGAGRGRIARQLLVEHLIVAVGGGLVGLLLALAGTDLLAGYAARFTTRAGEIGVDTPVVLFTLGLSVLTGLLFGAAPALVDRRSVTRTLGAGGNTTQGGGRRRAHAALVVMQVSVSFTLLVGAGLMLKSFWQVRSVDPGLEIHSVVSFRATLAGPEWDRAADRAFFRELHDRLLDVPGVEAVARTVDVPIADRHDEVFAFHLVEPGSAEDRPFPAEDAEPMPPRPPEGAETAWGRTVGPDYFRVLGAALVEGRFLDRRDQEGSPFVAVVNRTFARNVFGDASPLGRRLVQCWEAHCNAPMTVVGVVDDMATRGPDEVAPPEVYRSTDQVDWGGSNMLLRVVGPVDDVTAVIPQVVHSIEPDVPVTAVETLSDASRRVMAPRRLTAVLLLAFAGVALSLTLAGLFGVLSLAASARTLEMGIRRALGARPGEVGRMVVREGLGLVAVGLGVGLVLALVLTRAMQSLLWGVGPGDPLTLAGATVLFVAVSWLACWLPARRMAALDVNDTLRSHR